MKQIETLVFDYGGVIVNIDDASVVKAMESLGVTAFKRLIHVRKIKRLMHQYINGLVAEAETLKEMLSLCRKGTTTCLLYTSPSPRDGLLSRMPSSA